MIKPITKYVTSDGAEFLDQEKASERENLISRVAAAVAPLGETPQAVKDGRGWVQHDPEVVLQVKDALVELCRAEGYSKTFKGFNTPGRDVHPFSYMARVLDDMGGPLCVAWRRIQNTDSQGREHQQPFFAGGVGRPAAEHVCIEDRRKS